MTPADTERLYVMMSDLRESVEGYRTDLNGRLRTLEQAEALRVGVDNGRAGIGRVVVASAAIAAAVGGIITLITTNV